jgi:hypothetical protein
MSGLRVNCRSCGTLIPAEDVNLETVLAKCRDCHAVFDFSNQVQRPATPAKQRRDRGEVPMPKAFGVEDLGNELKIVHKWSRGVAVFFVIFAVFWNGIVSVFVGAALFGVEFKDSRTGQPAGNFIWLFLTPFLLVGFGMGYAALSLLFNRTFIDVRDGLLSVRHGPFPWPGGKQVQTSDLEQLYCEEYVAYRQNNRPVYRIALRALTKAGDRIKIVGGLDGAEQGVYLEQLLEKHLRIEDRPVSGEHRA